jgi:hypothetical protein
MLGVRLVLAWATCPGDQPGLAAPPDSYARS